MGEPSFWDNPEKARQTIQQLKPLNGLLRPYEELSGKVASDPGGRPIFAYTQPQNLHIRALAGDTHPRDERAMVPDASFFRPAAAMYVFKYFCAWRCTGSSCCLPPFSCSRSHH